MKRTTPEDVTNGGLPFDEGEKFEPKGLYSLITGFLKRVRVKALRKLGISTTGAIYQFPVTVEDFELYRTGKRVVFIANERFAMIGGDPRNFEIGDIVRLIETDVDARRTTGREAHFFIKDIIDFIPHISGATYKILTLE